MCIASVYANSQSITVLFIMPKSVTGCLTQTKAINGFLINAESMTSFHSQTEGITGFLIKAKYITSMCDQHDTGSYPVKFLPRQQFDGQSGMPDIAMCLDCLNNSNMV